MELANTGKGEASLLQSLAIQAKTCVLSARMNLLQLGRVLTEAKPLVQHGEWEAWVKENAQMSVRAAQSYMQAYATFGLNPEIAKLGTTKTMKLLPLSAEERDALFKENDIQDMSTRQLDEAIRAQKEKLRKEIHAETDKEIEKERTARIELERKAEEEKLRHLDIQKETLKSLKDSERRRENQAERIRELSAKYKTAEKERSRLAGENQRLEEENREQAEILEEQQADYNRMQEELLSVKSSIAKGDAERLPTDHFTPDIFASAVRAFIGSCARMPHMTAAFSCMSAEEKANYDELLTTVESWAESSRKALESVTIDGEVILRD